MVENSVDIELDQGEELGIANNSFLKKVIETNTKSVATPIKELAHISDEEKVTNGVLFHATTSIVEIIKSGYLTTQAVLLDENPDHLRKLMPKRKELPTPQTKKWAPLLPEDQNILHFSINTIDGIYSRGASFLVIEASNLLVDQPVFFRFGHKSGLKAPAYANQLCVSDVISNRGTFVESSPKSKLKIPLSLFKMFVPETKKGELKVILKNNHYPQTWIDSHLQTFPQIQSSGEDEHKEMLAKVVEEAIKLKPHKSKEKAGASLSFTTYSYPSEDQTPILKATTK